MWSQLGRYALRIVMGCALVLMVGAGVLAKRGVLDLQRMEERNTVLSKQIDEALAEKESLEKLVQRLQSDTAEQERVIRLLLGYVRPGETIIDFAP